MRYKQPDFFSEVFFDAALPDTRFAATVAEYGMLLRGSRFKGDASFKHAVEREKPGNTRRVLRERRPRVK